MSSHLAGNFLFKLHNLVNLKQFDALIIGKIVTVLSFTLRVKFVLAYQQLRSTVFYTACTSWISL